MCRVCRREADDASTSRPPRGHSGWGVLEYHTVCRVVPEAVGRQAIAIGRGLALRDVTADDEHVRDG